MIFAFVSRECTGAIRMMPPRMLSQPADDGDERVPIGRPEVVRVDDQQPAQQ